MARQVRTVTITDDGRDKGKVFVLTELPASRAEEWATRAIFALMNSGAELPDGFERSGMAGMAQVGFKALGQLPWEIAKPLLAEMFECVQIMPTPSRPDMLRGLLEDDIEEIMTRVKLRAEVFKLHVDFSKAVASLNSTGTAAQPKTSQNTKTSRR